MNLNACIMHKSVSILKVQLITLYPQNPITSIIKFTRLSPKIPQNKDLDFNLHYPKTMIKLVAFLIVSAAILKGSEAAIKIEGSSILSSVPSDCDNRMKRECRDEILAGMCDDPESTVNEIVHDECCGDLTKNVKYNCFSNVMIEKGKEKSCKSNPYVRTKALEIWEYCLSLSPRV